MDANEIAQYLKDHPEFFVQYADLLAQIHIPSPHGDKAISITERQMFTLRDKAKQLEAKLAELIRFGEENDAISDKVHAYSIALAAAADLPAVLRAVYAHLGGAFAVPHVLVRLWPDGVAEATPELEATTEGVRAAVAALTHPYCGPTAGQETAEWFGESGGHVRSMAQVALRRGDDCFGVLLLASEEAHRFYPEMGTLYLERIGGLTAAALGRVLG
jgi:hypothetical protein